MYIETLSGRGNLLGNGFHEKLRRVYLKQDYLGLSHHSNRARTLVIGACPAGT